MKFLAIHLEHRDHCELLLADHHLRLQQHFLIYCHLLSPVLCLRNKLYELRFQCPRRGVFLPGQRPKFPLRSSRLMRQLFRPAQNIKVNFQVAAPTATFLDLRHQCDDFFRYVAQSMNFQNLYLSLWSLFPTLARTTDVSPERGRVAHPAKCL